MSTMSKFIPYGRQQIDESDIQAVIDVLRSDFLTQGPAVEAFEKRLADYCGVKYAVAVSNATAALHIGAAAAGLKSGDRLWTSPITFVASANCGLYCGATPDFVDIDPRSYNMSPDRLAEKLARAKQEGTLPKLLVPVHLTGQPCDMERIHALAKQYGVMVMEDASHAVGARYKGRPVGNCDHSDMAVFSFHPVKIVTTGEGGAVLTNNPALYEKLKLLRSHGITRDSNLMTHAPDGPWYYQQVDLGWNYRLTDLQAALGTAQMRRVDEFVKKRRWVAARYNELLKNLPLTLPWQSPDSESAYHLYVIRLQLDKIKKTHRQVFEALQERKLGVNLHYIPVHTQPFYSRFGFKNGMFPESEAYYSEAISLPMFPGLEEIDLIRIHDSICNSL
jgi:UDP-4-amino-4,6-dideoxy-N-acetyl-beta-L-altrosamine transaminase